MILNQEFRRVLKYFKNNNKKAVEDIRPRDVTELIISARSTDSGWGQIYYGNVTTLAKLIGASRITEIGVAYGGHAYHLLSDLPKVKYVGVDPYLYNYDPKDQFCSDVQKYLGLIGQEAMDRLHDGVVASLESFNLRFELQRIASLEYAASLPMKSEQLVFLDGNHTFEYVSKELTAWWPTIGSGGVLAGDDYWMPQVARAVNHFVEEKKLDLRFISKNENLTWFIYKN